MKFTLKSAKNSKTGTGRYGIKQSIFLLFNDISHMLIS